MLINYSKTEVAREMTGVTQLFVADSSIRSKVIRGSQNFEIGSRDLGHAQLLVIL